MPLSAVVGHIKDKALQINDPKEKVQPQKKPALTQRAQKASRSYTTTESEDSGEDMAYLEPMNSLNPNINRRVKTSLSAFLDDSDSESEEGAMEKLAAAISDLFTGEHLYYFTFRYYNERDVMAGDWNEHENSECEHSSEEENDVSEGSRSKEANQAAPFGKCLYVILNSRDTLNVTVTTTFLKVKLVYIFTLLFRNSYHCSRGILKVQKKLQK